MNKVLFVTYGGGHAAIVSNIVDYVIKNEPTIQPIILALTMSYPTLLKRFGSRVTKNISEFTFLFKHEYALIKSLAEEFGPENYNPKLLLERQITFDYIGLSMWDLIETHGDQVARSMYENKSRQAFLPVLVMERIIKMLEVSTVVATTSPRFELASIIAAKNLSIPSVQIIDLFADLNPLPSANKICVMNDSVKHEFSLRGINVNDVVVTGQPAIEASAKLVNNKCAKKIKQRFTTLSTNKSILLATQKLVTCHSDLSRHNTTDNLVVYTKIFDLLQTVQKNTGCNILIRIHPSESALFYKDLLEKHPSFLLINELLDLAESIAVSEVVLTHSSTVAIEAAASNRQALTFRHEFDETYPVQNLTKPPFIHSINLSDLEVNINQALNASEINNKNQFLKLDSASNITKVIKSSIC